MYLQINYSIVKKIIICKLKICTLCYVAKTICASAKECRGTWLNAV